MLLHIIICLCVSSTLATDITYENVTQANFTELQDTDVSLPGLSHLFVMSRNFVDVVFQPFTVIEEFVFEAVSGADSDAVGNLLSQWQTLVSFEVGFMVCFVFGCLFVILVPLVGLIMCCCRSCCNNCGGELKQSEERAESKWRHCFCGTLLIFTIFMAIPCIFVYLTNVWASEALQKVPVVTNSALQDLNNYIVNVPRQLEHVIGEYGKLNDSIRSDISNINTSLGVPIRDSFLGFTQPTLDRLTALSNDTVEARDALEAVQEATTALNDGIGTMNTALNATKDALDDDLTDAGATCTGNPYCQAVIESTIVLSPTGADFSSLGNIQTELNNINETLNNFDINAEVNEIIGTINDIPDLVSENSEQATDGVLRTLDGIDSSLDSALSNLPIEQIEELEETIENVSDSISDALELYNRDFDVYRYAAGAVLASVIAIIVVLYLLGMISGSLSFSATPYDRSGCSNCGGIFIMSAVGLSFIFSWLLMILVIIFFTIGGHGERYLCQNLEAPYEGLKFADRVINQSGTTGQFSISLFTTITECEQDESIYVAARLQNVYDVRALVEDAVSTVDDFRGNLSDLAIDLGNINTYPPDIERALNDMKESGIESINFTAYLEQISRGLTTGNLANYAQFLNDSADNMTAIETSTPETEQLADTIRGHSYQVLLVQRNQVDPLSDSLATLNSSILRLQEIANGFNDSIDALEEALLMLNNSIQTNGSQRVTNVTIAFANSIIDDVLGYVTYALGQVTERFGRCRPIFIVYTKMTDVLCSYLIEILNGFWFSLGWCVFFLIPSAIVGMKLAKFYRRMPQSRKLDEWNNDMQMDEFGQANNSYKRNSWKP